ncbi:PQQ-binding-like beta-propeller repeat protein [Enemella sp. A6]|uniref:outer membrane protein assembly factor BamB family protein n=1 Tax=Enemella sp. A6 TaxID=3440152 RepID=UPI003EC092F8
MALVAIGMLAASLVAAAPSGRLEGGRAAELIGADGHSQVLAGPQGEQAEQREWAHLYGFEAFNGPYEFFYLPTLQDEGGMTLDEALRTQWIRHTTTLADGSQAHVLYSLDKTGLHLHLTMTDKLVIAYVPGRLDVPADVAPGDEWDFEGRMHVYEGKSYAYTSRADASEAEEFGAECVRIRHTDEVEGIGEIEQNLVWCPGRGVVADGDLAVTEIDRPQREYVEQKWNPQNWKYQQPVSQQLEGNELRINPISQPLGTTGRSAAPYTTQDVLAFDDNWIYRGVNRPGGKVVAATQVQELSLIATSERTITAVTDTLWRRWQIEVPDVIVQLIPAGPDHFVSVNSNGRVSLHALDDGAVVWQRNYPGAADFAVTVRDGRVFVVSGRQQITALDQADGKTLGTVELPDNPVAVGGAGDLLVAVGDSGRMFAFGTDGTARWSTQTDGTQITAHIVVTDREVVYGDSDQVVGMDRETGQVVWRYDLDARQLVTDGEYLVVYAQSHLTVLRGGEVMHQWALPVEYATSDFYCGALPDGVACIDGVGRISEARP